jgi:hypothetical protein
VEALTELELDQELARRLWPEDHPGWRLGRAWLLEVRRLERARAA